MSTSRRFALIAVATAFATAVPAAAYAIPTDKGTLACEIFQSARVKSRSTHAAGIRVPNGVHKVYDWGTTTYRSYTIVGSKAGSGEWEVQTYGELDANGTYGYCS